MLHNKTIILGVSGGIAAYKAADLASKLTQEGAAVKVIMTQAATHFVTPLTFESLTGSPVTTSVFDTDQQSNINHIALAATADLIVIAPATADLIARLTHGLADDALTAAVLASKAPVVIFPSMHTNMYEHEATRHNLEVLRKRGVRVVEPETGRLASGGYGAGRLPETARIIQIVGEVLAEGQDLSGMKVLVTAGGTREPLDPVRFLGNRSSGKMGYAIAQAATDRGAAVTLVTTATLQGPAGAEIIPVETAEEIRKAVLERFDAVDVLIMAAAVADFKPAEPSAKKIHKAEAPQTIQLKPTPDILQEVASLRKKQIVVGFAAESENLIPSARKKLKDKQLDLIVANDISQPGVGFGSEKSRAVLIGRQGKEEDLGIIGKRALANLILDRLIADQLT